MSILSAAIKRNKGALGGALTNLIPGGGIVKTIVKGVAAGVGARIGIGGGGFTGGGGGAPTGGGLKKDRFDLNPFSNDSPTLGGLSIITDAQQVEKWQAPPGYVLYYENGNAEGDEEPIAVLAAVAYSLGLRRRPQRGGGISRKDIQRARHVQKIIGKLTVNREPRMKIKGKR